MSSLSIITINYNNASGLIQTINSVVSQNYKDIEYIVIDGGSTDGSVEIIKQNETSIDYWVSEKDNGIYNAINKGIRYATGEYLIFLNSGDCLNNANTIRNCYNYIRQFSEIDIFYGDIYVKNDKDIDETWKRGYPSKLTLSFFKESTINHQATLISSKLFQQFGFYPEQYMLAADYWFFLKVLINNKQFVHLGFPMVIYDNSGISAKNMDKYTSEMQVIWNELVPDCVQDLIAENQRLKKVERYTLVKIAIKLNYKYQKLKNWK